MTKEDSLHIKGIAILMMLFLHLFNNEERVAQCECLLQWFDGRSLPYAMSRVAAWCVPIYIFLSGYGLAAKYSEGHLSVPSAIHRLVPLYVNYWVVFVPFVLLGCLLRPDLYPGDLETLAMNVAALSCTYNNEWWFLLPYMVLVWMSPFVIRSLFAGPRDEWRLFFEAVVLYVLSGVGYRFWPGVFDGDWFLTLVQHVCQLFLMFLCGALFFRHDCFARFTLWLQHQSRHARWVAAVLLLLLCLLRMSLEPVIINPLFVLPVMLLCGVLRPRGAVLLSLGRQSATMWFCHTFFAYYLFGDFVYGLRYPLFVFLGLTVVSWTVSVPLTRLSSWLTKHLVRVAPWLS